MTHKYTAKIFLEKDEIMHNTGDDLDELYAWMISRSEGVFGNVHGKVIDNATQEILKQFRKTPPD